MQKKNPKNSKLAGIFFLNLNSVKEVKSCKLNLVGKNFKSQKKKILEV